LLDKVILVKEIFGVKFFFLVGGLILAEIEGKSRGVFFIFYFSAKTKYPISLLKTTQNLI